MGQTEDFFYGISFKNSDNFSEKVCLLNAIRSRPQGMQKNIIS